ncbi:uncharacterized protein LOC115980967 [Quercus lobata]|uniref:uncharacterized protein LOC115980967 n=1 Tax=Quercus lobata TaxID=97700 RepID=UPI0012455626|nr:uncharacterized protein LOC115980967 [Quercus lobata]
MIHQFFVPTDAAAILSILLSSRPPDDRLVWAFTSKEEFTVKGAYKVAMASANTDQSGEESNSQNRKLFWKSIWKLNVPNKIKSFARRANKNILPTKANLEFVDLLWHLKFVEQQGDEILELVITVAWCLWFNINEARLGNARAQASAILHKACYLLEEFQVANFRLSSPVNNGEVRWAPPPESRYKINTDGAVFTSFHSIGISHYPI